MKRVLFWKVFFAQAAMIAFALVLFGAHRAGSVSGLCVVVVLPLLAAAVLSGLVYWSMKKKLEALSSFAGRLAGGELHSRITVHRRDVTSRLKENMNTMAEGLEASFRSLQARKILLEEALAGMTDGVLILDASGRVMLANSALQGLFGIQGDCLGRPFMEALRHHGLAEMIRNVMEQRTPLSGEVELLFPQKAWVAASAEPIIRESMREDRFLGAVVTIHDITKIRNLERVRKDFVANVSHELKTPVAAIRGFAETLLDGAMQDSEAAGRFLGVIQSHAARLQRLVDDLLTLSRIELGETTFAPGPVDAGGMIAEAVLLMTPQAGSKEVTISTAIAPGLPLVHADRDRIAQVLLNLLDNAIKFTPEGGSVQVTAKRADGEGRESGPDRHGGAWIEIIVADTGPGIPPQLIPRLGERFYRVDPSRARELGSTGLGLAIVKHLLQAHGTALHISNARRGGTIVSFRLPSSPSLSQ